MQYAAIDHNRGDKPRHISNENYGNGTYDSVQLQNANKYTVEIHSGVFYTYFTHTCINIYSIILFLYTYSLGTEYSM